MDPRRKRILYRATHRGTKEADLAIGGFVRDRLDLLDEDGLTLIEALLEAQDVDILDWITGRALPPPPFDAPLFAPLFGREPATR